MEGHPEQSKSPSTALVTLYKLIAPILVEKLVSVGRCLDQNDSSLKPFPCCPVADAPDREKFLFRPDVAPVFVTRCRSMVDIYNKVKHVGVPNYRGARVPLTHGLNIPVWRKYADFLVDKSLPDMLEFGFPNGHMATEIPALGLVNHASATHNPVQVGKFIDKEISHGALAGPFSKPPFTQWYRNNPLMTRPKDDSDELRVILVLSFPTGSSVNSHVSRESLDGANFKLKLPSPLDLARTMVRLGKGCKLYKIDLSRAYRQLRGDPLDWPLMGIDWDGSHYVDLAIPLGCATGPLHARGPRRRHQASQHMSMVLKPTPM